MTGVRKVGLLLLVMLFCISPNLTGSVFAQSQPGPCGPPPEDPSESPPDSPPDSPSGVPPGDSPGGTVSTMPANADYPPDWCVDVEITGPGTVRKADGSWEGSVAPAVSGVNLTIEWNGEGSEDSSVALVNDGAGVEVTLGEGACGSFRVVMTNSCGQTFYGPWVRITDAGCWCVHSSTGYFGCRYCASSCTAYCHDAASGLCHRIRLKCSCHDDQGWPNPCAAKCPDGCNRDWGCDEGHGGIPHCTCTDAIDSYIWKCESDCDACITHVTPCSSECIYW